MRISVTFKNIDPSESLKNYVQEKLNRFDKLLDNPAEANVVLSVEKLRHIAEIKLIGDRLSINAKEENNDMYAAIDLVLDKLKKQIKRSKQKVRERRSSGKESIKDVEEETMPLSPDGGGKTVQVQYIDYKPMDVEEAVLQLDLINDQFFVFTNARTDRVNVLYRRKDGNYGLIQPIGS